MGTNGNLSWRLLQGLMLLIGEHGGEKIVCKAAESLMSRRFGAQGMPFKRMKKQVGDDAGGQGSLRIP